MPAYRYRLGDRGPRPHQPHAGDGHPEPHARLVLRPRRARSSSMRSSAGPRSSSTRAPTSSTSVASRPGPGPRSTRPRSSTGWSRRSRRSTPASTSPSPATPGGRRCSPRRAGPAPSSATTSAGSATPTYLAVAAAARRVGRGDPHPPRAPRRRPRSALRRPRRRRHRVPPRPRPRGPEPAGLAPEQIAIDAGLDLGKTPAQSAVLLRESDALARHRVHAAPLGVEQALPRRPARARHRRPPRRVARGGGVRRRARVSDRPRPRRRRRSRCAA